MSNTSIPYDLGINDITSNGVMLVWDVHNTAEFKPGTFYKVYISEDGLNFNFFDNANIKTIHAPLKLEPFWFKVTSVVNNEESAQSAAFKVEEMIGNTDERDSVSIAVNSKGEPVRLRVNEDGELIVAAEMSVGDDINVSLAGMATETKQDDIIVLLGEIRDNNTSLSATLSVEFATLRDILSSTQAAIVTAIEASETTISNHLTSIESKIDLNTAKVTQVNASVNLVVNGVTGVLHAVEDNKASVDALKTVTEEIRDINDAKLAEISTKLDNLSTSVDANIIPPIIKAEHTFSLIGTSGSTVYLPWKSKAKVDRITVLKEGGTATRWTVEILDKAAPVTERNIVMRDFSYELYDSNRMDIIKTFSFVNVDGNDLIGIRLTPDAGSSNTFYVCIMGTESR